VWLTSLLDHPGPVMLQFIFTTCTTVCPIMSQTVSGVQARLGSALDSALILSISIDPENDTPSRLAEYAQRFKATDQWVFLTGRAEDIVAVQKAFRTYEGNKMSHRPLTFLRAASSSSWVRIEGLPGVAELASEYQRLQAH
jgi:protein SCO1/2